MSKKNYSDKHSGRNDTEQNSNNKSQRRLALVVLVVLLAGLIYLLVSDGTAAVKFRKMLFEQIGITQEDTDQETGGGTSSDKSEENSGEISDLDISDLPEYNGKNYVVVNDNVPVFAETVYTDAGLIRNGDRWKTEGTFKGINSNKVVSYESYGKLDSFGRCTGAVGCLSNDTMPEQDEERGDISSIHPSGWAKAQNWERCHLIAWALSNENANERNLITGTHYLNYDGMRPLEEEVEHYIWNTGNHVLYEAIPYFAGSEKVARGVQMKAWSVEDDGDGISFNVYCFNVTPGAEINYETGIVTTAEQAAQSARLYVINKRSKVFHYPSCEGAQSISEWNREEVTATRSELTSKGYTPCGYCEP